MEKHKRPAPRRAHLDHGTSSERVVPLPLWAQLALVFTVPLWVPLAPAAGWWRSRR